VQVGGGDLAVLPDFRGMAKRKVLDRCIDMASDFSRAAQESRFIVAASRDTNSVGIHMQRDFAKGNPKEQLAAAEASYAAQQPNDPQPTADRN